MTAILIADDDPGTRDLVAFTPEQAGYDVISVDNGLDVYRELRGDSSTAAPPIILLTAQAVLARTRA